MFDYSKLNGRIIEKFGSKRCFADAIGKSEVTVSRKLLEKTAISVEDIITWSGEELLDIPANEIPEYFFKLEVQ